MKFHLSLGSLVTFSFSLANLSSISRSLAAVSTGLAPPKIELLDTASDGGGTGSIGLVLGANCNFGLSFGPWKKNRNITLFFKKVYFIHTKLKQCTEAMFKWSYTRVSF